jgi:beta-glucanase (GH16 family)
MGKKKLLLILIVFTLIASDLYAGGWKLYWSDEFDSTGYLNPNNWWIRVASAGWVNGEQQRYTDGHDQENSNIYIKNGFLIIVAKKSSSGEITSGRIESENKKQFMYGRMECRARLPIGKGYWPAFWMLGWDINKGVGWPRCGELDIMEGKGRLPNWTSGAFHCAAGTPVKAGNYTLPSNVPNFHDAFHIFAAEWNTDTIRWYADTVNFLTMTKAQVPTAPIDKDYFFTVNLAVGGGFDGNVDATTPFPESLIVDYVRVYKWDPNVGTEFNKIKSQMPSLIKLLESKTFFEIELPFYQEYKCEVISLKGEKVISIKGINKSFGIETESLNPGIYLVKVETKTERFSGKILIKK